MIYDYEPPHFLQVGHLHQIISRKTWVSETNEKRGDFHDPSYSNWYYMRIPANFFLVKFVRYLPCHGRDFRKCPSDVRRFLTNARRCSDKLWPLLKPFKRRQFKRVLISLGHKVIIQFLIGTFSCKLNCIFVINLVLKNSLFGFVSQVWEIVLDAWDRCL